MSDPLVGVHYELAGSYSARDFNMTITPQNGGVLGSLSVSVYIQNSTTLASIYSDDTLTTALANPIVTTDGVISFWVLDNTETYNISITGDSLCGAYNIGDIWAYDDGIYAVEVRTKQNVGQLYSAANLIRGAFRLIQVASSDSTLTASEMNDGLESLNRMLDSWSADELTLYQIIRESFSLTNGQNPYTIGYGGEFNTSRPIKIVGAQLNLYNANLPVTYPMQVLQYDDYNSIRLKTLATNFPQYLYYNPSFPLGEILIYPVFSASGSSTSATITLSSWKPIDVIDCLDSTLSFPPGYWEALVFNLAIRMAEEYQFDIRPQTMMLAAQALKRIKQQNRRVPTLSSDAALMTTNQRRYNIYSDGSGA